MNDLIAMDISGAGMNAQRVRMRVIAENLANQSTVGPNGPYQRKETIIESVPMSEFATELDAALGDVLTPEELDALHSVTVKEVRPDNSDPILRHLPSHPYADDKGNVAFPNISIIREMADMMEATRSYEANLAAMRTTRQMIDRAIELLA